MCNYFTLPLSYYRFLIAWIFFFFDTAEREGSFWCSHQSRPSATKAEEKEEQSTKGLLNIVIEI